jgi:hypothetical protein
LGVIRELLLLPLLFYHKLHTFKMSFLLRRTSFAVSRALGKPRYINIMTATSAAATTTPAAVVASLDHLVLTVKSIPATTKWYEENLGMRHESFTSASTPDIRRHSLIFGNQKINLHEAGKVCRLHFTS